MSTGRSWLLGSLFVGFCTLSAAGQGLRWTHDGAGGGVFGGNSWFSQHVSLGDQGGQVFAELGTGDPAQLLSAYDLNPPAAVWEQLQTATPRSVDSAAETDIHASLLGVGTSYASLQLNCYSSASPLWSYTFPFTAALQTSSAVRVTPDGRKVVAGARNLAASSTTRLHVAVFDARSGAQTAYRTLDFYGSFSAFEISRDGRLLFVAGTPDVKVFDLQTGALVHSESAGPLWGGAMSPDASVFAVGGNGTVKIYRRSGSSYVQDFVYNSGTNRVCDRLAISADGTTLACGFYTLGDTARADIRALDLATGSVTMSDTITAYSPAGYQNKASDIVISEDGRRIAAGLWGDETGTARELMVYDSDSSQPIASYDLPGSAYDLDLSPDGKLLVAASKTGHANSFGFGTGRIDLYELEPLDFDLRGVPRSGHTVTFEMEGAPGTQGMLLASTEKATPPRFVPHLGGILYLARRGVVPSSMGTVDWTGTARASRTVTGPVGSARYYQGLAAMPAGLTERWVKVTVLP